jgi:hypothetical protein
MNRIVYIIFLAALVSSCSEDTIKPIQDINYHWDIRSDTLNVAVLMFDYETYKFEGGALSYYKQCLNCGIDSIPMDMDYRSPGDFGWGHFKHSVTGDTIFFGTIIWAGTGKISVPKYIYPADSFETIMFRRVKEPSVVKLFPSRVSISEVQTEAIWTVASHLDIVHAFNKFGSFNVGYYMYPPRVGIFDPRVAKWIVFLIQ